MAEYYIRTPEQDESRGPFDVAKLATLADAGQITENTLYYDETKEEWIPIALNEELKTHVFPEREKLSLKIEDNEDSSENEEAEEEDGINVEDMLKAAEADTKETRHLRQSQKSFERAVALASMTLGLMMLLSAVSFIFPHLAIIQGAVDEQLYSSLPNYPFLLLGVFDLFMAVLLLLSVTDIYPLIRGRSMIGLGFGVYLGWAIGDPQLMLLFGLGGIGVFLATITQKISVMIAAILMGIGCNGILAYLAISGRFDEFYSIVQINLIAQ
ncbi:MAG: GYF domain-containing protein [Verrucomicrobiota bacterium]